MLGLPAGDLGPSNLIGSAVYRSVEYLGDSGGRPCPLVDRSTRGAQLLTGIDHSVIAVHDLEKSRKDFEAAGFTVTPGGSHPTGTHNALIAFSDGSYLELTAIEKPELAKDHPWLTRMGGKQGFVTFAVGTDSLDDEVQRLESRGLTGFHRRDGARTRPDGQQLRWLSSAIDADLPVLLSFLIQDVTDQSLRVLSGKDAEHRNGVKGTTGLTIVTSDLQQAMTPFGQMFCAPVAALDHGIEGVQQAGRSFVEEYWLDLVQPQDETSPLAEHHRIHGDCIYQISLTVEIGPEFRAARIDIPDLPDVHIFTMN